MANTTSASETTPEPRTGHEPQHSEEPENPYEPRTHSSDPPARGFNLTRKLLGREEHPTSLARQETASKSDQKRPALENRSLTTQIGDGRKRENNGKSRPGAGSRPAGGDDKLGTFAGVFVPTTLNVLSILMFLRFGFILGQGGLLGFMAMLVASYLINLVTTLSISAIASNGTVRGGGAYYLISRSLGPEFGGSIGIVFYLGLVFNTGMNAVGLVDCLKENFGVKSGNWYHWLPDNFWFDYLWATIVLCLCTAICLAGSSIFARASKGLLAILLLSTFSIPFSVLIKKPFNDQALGVKYTGLSTETFMDNLMPRLTKGAAGTQLRSKETFQDLFGILFPATGGIFAGASMSGNLKHPSKAIPKGTLSGLLLTFTAYALVIFAMAASIARESFYQNLNVIQNVNISAVLVLLGEFSTSFFSALMGVIGSAKLLQALARDNLIPGFSIFSQGTIEGDEPTYGILITHVAAQLTMLLNINNIASFITMTYLMTFLVTNLACFLLKISSAPNFRPSFRFFNWETALAGTLISAVTMFFVDGLFATGCFGILLVIFSIIHYTSPPKSWGDVSQSLIYHQVRKYLLRLRQEHVKFWRPQILLLTNSPRRQFKLIQFCNSLKKGGLYILGHVIVTNDFSAAVPEARRQQSAWMKYIDLSRVKAFVNISIAPAIEWGVRNIIMNSGLGGMRPNVAVLALYNLEERQAAKPLVDITDHSQPTTTSPNTDRAPVDSKAGRTENGKNEVIRDTELPTDACRTEGSMSPQSYVLVLENLLLNLQINVAVAKGFQFLELPLPHEENTKKYIDLWPIQMSAEIAAEGDKGNILTTNFDTYTLILQLGCILTTVPSWKHAYRLRVCVFVEYESDVEEERNRVKSLLTNLRIKAEVCVFWLASGTLELYEVVVNGAEPSKYPAATLIVDKSLEVEEWWDEVQRLRGHRERSATEHLSAVEGLVGQKPRWPDSSFLPGYSQSRVKRFGGLRRLLSSKRSTFGGLSALGVNLGMTTHRLPAGVVDAQEMQSSSSDDDSSDSDDATDTDRSYDSRPNRAQRRPSAATENDVDVTNDDDSEVEKAESLRRRSFAEGSFRDYERKPTARAESQSRADPPRRPRPAQATKSSKSVPSSQAPSRPTSRPPTIRQSSNVGKFSSKPVPKTTVSTEDGPGPSIMFTDPTPSPTKARKQLDVQPEEDHQEDSETQAAPASGFPTAQAVPLSFNDLPCRAQHLILNELMKQQSGQDTAVLFTTLPSPAEGTHRNEEDSLRFLGDLDVLCKDLPPIMLVHSNSLTVTMNL